MLYEYELDLYRHQSGQCDSPATTILYHTEKISKEQILGFIAEIKKSLQTPETLEKMHKDNSDKDFFWRLSTRKGSFFSTKKDMRPEIIGELVKRFGFMEENPLLSYGLHLSDNDADWIIDYKNCSNLPEIIEKCAEADNESYKRKLETEIAEAQKKLARL